MKGVTLFKRISSAFLFSEFFYPCRCFFQTHTSDFSVNAFFPNRHVVMVCICYLEWFHWIDLNKNESRSIFDFSFLCIQPSMHFWAKAEHIKRNYCILSFLFYKYSIRSNFETFRLMYGNRKEKRKSYQRVPIPQSLLFAIPLNASTSSFNWIYKMKKRAKTKKRTVLCFGEVVFIQRTI